ncbi:type II secretion system protein [Patescibacteria group bacterium]|nr:type II secretion system protein [Patescibacteria group bacterium]
MKSRSIESHNRGFTLIELLVVIAIIGLLSSIVLAAVNIARMHAIDASRTTNLLQVQQAIELYYSDNNLYPKSYKENNPQNTGNGIFYVSGQCVEGNKAPIIPDSLGRSVINGLPLGNLSGGYIAQLPSDTKMNVNGNNCCYTYYVTADHQSYKYTFDGCALTGSADGTGSFKDPVHSGAWSVYSPGGANL